MERYSIDVNGPRSVKVIGVGGAGTNILGALLMEDFGTVEFRRVNRTDGPEFCCIGTDAQHLEMSPVEMKILMGPRTTHGTGAGGDAHPGEIAADESEDEIVRFLDDGEIAFLIAGLGGDTGTRASRHIAKKCKDLGLTTVGIFIVPFESEEEGRKAKAQEDLGELCGLCDVVLMMKNDMRLCPSTMPSLNAAFEATARPISGAIDDILRMMRYLRQPENASRCKAQTSGNASQFVLETSTCGRETYG